MRGKGSFYEEDVSFLCWFLQQMAHLMLGQLGMKRRKKKRKKKAVMNRGEECLKSLWVRFLAKKKVFVGSLQLLCHASFASTSIVVRDLSHRVQHSLTTQKLSPKRMFGVCEDPQHQKYNC